LDVILPGGVCKRFPAAILLLSSLGCILPGIN
jgi:hypothetical protein